MLLAQMYIRYASMNHELLVALIHNTGLLQVLPDHLLAILAMLAVDPVHVKRAADALQYRGPLSGQIDAGCRCACPGRLDVDDVPNLRKPNQGFRKGATYIFTKGLSPPGSS